jgi:hypothetical protein
MRDAVVVALLVPVALDLTTASERGRLRVVLRNADAAG